MGYRVIPNGFVFELDDGDLSVWIDQEEIYIRAVDRQSRDPLEIPPKEAKQLAAVLLELAGRIHD